MTIDSAQINSVCKTGLTMDKSLPLGTRNRPLSVLTSVCNKQVNFL